MSMHKIYGGLMLGAMLTSSVYADNKILGAPSWSTPERGVSLESSAVVKANATTSFNVVGSSQHYTQQEIDDKFSAPDWFPSQHEAMPSIVKSGKAPKVWACASCHLASGAGHPESATLSGLSSQYIQSQMNAFSDGTRLDYSGHMNRMSAVLTKDEITAVSDWFATLTSKKVTDVVEVAQVPKTYLDDTRMRLKGLPAEMEDIAGRIIEIPADLEKVKKRHPESSFISYVPQGSIARGKNLVTTGGGKTIPCASCHGADLTGSTIGPAITGNFASYTVRQLHGFKGGTRKGGQSALMLGVVGALTDNDIVDISAYLTSLPVN
ncbi:c-type cytochrome [Cognaticolwellia mytili]|uniref:c-type cytochrome n=1 Tax=Cognaticolwellia mytili TaxID=1888913 RepID=UPI000A16D470|nr:c-type cytochrome [Cognaticolwellia mytili]